MSLLQLPNQNPVTWAREGRYGNGGTWGFEIDASGLETRNRFMSRETVSAIPDTSYRIVVRLFSTLIASNNGFEGIAARMRGFKLEGTTPENMTFTQVWDSNPEAGGQKQWFSAQTNGYEDVAFIVDNVPNDIDALTLEIVVRAQSGQVRLHNVECRHLFQKTNDWALSGTRSVDDNGFSYEEIPVIQRDGVDNFQARESSFFHYISDPIDFDITKGKMIEVDGTAVVQSNTIVSDPSVTGGFRQIEISLGVSVRFKVRNETRFHMVEASSVTGIIPTLRKPPKIREEAREHYDQYQIIITVTPREAVNATDVDPLIIVDLIETSVRALDYIRPSQ